MDLKEVRSAFPVLSRTINGKPIVYLDSACMALKPDAVVEAMRSYYHRFPACAGLGRSAHALGREVDEAVYRAREQVRRLINARPCSDAYAEATPTKEIVFTRNATEAINLIARGYPFGQDAVVLTTDREHNSNLCPWQDMAARGVIRHLWVPSNPDNTFDLAAYEEILERENVELVSMVHISNVDGYELPAAKVVEMAHAYGAKVMLDAAQSAPHVPIDVQALDVDLLALSVHKICGPTGIGVLYGREELLCDKRLQPLITGGDTVEETSLNQPPRYLDPPFRFEAGLQDYAGIIGAGAALDFVQSVGLEAIGRHVDELNVYLCKKLESLQSEFDVIGPKDPVRRNGITTLCFKRRGIVSLFMEDVSGVGQILDHWANIMVRTGEFCVHSWFDQRGISREREKLRVSLYLYNTREDCDIFVDGLRRLIKLDEYQMLPRIA